MTKDMEDKGSHIKEGGTKEMWTMMTLYDKEALSFYVRSFNEMNHSRVIVTFTSCRIDI